MTKLFASGGFTKENTRHKSYAIKYIDTYMHTKVLLGRCWRIKDLNILSAYQLPHNEEISHLIPEEK